MRDVLAVASVIVLALGFGGAAAYMSVDLSPPGLELIRPPKPAVVERIKREETQRAVQAEASECKYCVAVAELAKTFSRRADTARRHAAALRTALPQVSDETDQTAGRLEELKAAQVAATHAEAAAVVLTGWASRCVAEDICKVPPIRAAASCATTGDPRPAAALLIAMSVRNAAQACATASCPAVDCKASASLHADIGQIENALDEAGGRMSGAAGLTNAAQLPVGTSTLKAELTRITDETSYVAKMLPLLLDDSKAKAASDRQLPKLAPEMVDQRAVSAAQLANVMEQAAAVTDNKSPHDPRTEAAWRLKSLAAHMAELGKDAQSLSGVGGKANWERVADSLGGALLDLARLQAMLDRVKKTQAAPEGCDGSVASAAQQLREAAAMLDLCRMRSACVGRGQGGTVQASSGDINATFERARASAEALTVNEIGEQQAVVQVADSTVQPSLIDMLRSKGVCRRAGELREAAVVAPSVAQAVAQAAVPPTFTAGIGVLAPQDVVAGAVQAAIEAPAPTDSIAPADTLVQAAARYSDAKPRRKPRSPLASDPAVMQVSAPRAPAAADDAYQGVVLPQAGGPQTGTAAFGGEGGPQQLIPPTGEAPPAKPR